MDEQDASTLDALDDYQLTGDEDDLPQVTEEPQEEEPSTEEPAPSTTEEPTQEDSDDSFTAEVLRLKGISDPSKIKFEDESGAIIERDWNSLTDTERLNILANEGDPERDLEDDEIQLINTLRQNNLTPQQYIQAIQQQAAQQALENYQKTQTPAYEIDSLSDDELFALDLLEKVGEENISDEELQEALTQAKNNPELFAKQVEGLRVSYKNLEDQQKYAVQQEEQQQLEQQYQDFSNKVLNAIGSFNSLANQDIELSTDDKNDIANYMLTRRESGVSDFYTDIQDPTVATQAAFWLLRGPEVLSEMENQVRAAYQRGFAMGKAQQPVPVVTPKTPKVVVQPKTAPTTSNPGFQSAFEIEDETYLN